jgi:hypothetical protein
MTVDVNAPASRRAEFLGAVVCRRCACKPDAVVLEASGLTRTANRVWRHAIDQHPNLGVGPEERPR